MFEKIKQSLIAVKEYEKNLIISYYYIEPLTLSNLKDYIGRTIYYSKKFACVFARFGKLGEIIETKPLVRYNNKIYTFSEVKCEITLDMVKKGATVVTDPDGEEYVISTKEKFLQKYKKEKNTYAPISGILRFVKVIKNICFDKNGEKVFVPKGCYMCLDDLTRSITNIAFEGTYKVLKKQKFNSNNVD